MRHPFCVENIDRPGSNGPLGKKMCNFDHKIRVFGAKSHFFVLEPRSLSPGHITSTPGATTFPFGPPQKNSVSEPEISVFGPKIRFCHTTPILVDDPFLALGMTVNFPPWKPFFDFPFRSYSCFRKKIRLTRQKVFPPPTVGVPSASKSPSALSAQALARGPDNEDNDHDK